MSESFILKTASETDTDEMAQVLAKELSDDGLLELILAIDLAVADYSFTVKVHRALGDAIEAEEDQGPSSP